MAEQFIKITGARQHNLKNLSLQIPREKLVVITGMSGSGKSSLAFDTLFAEGQRRYVESLSAYARQFLDQMQKPDVDFIEGLSPAIALEQRTAAANPRSTIATTTEIYDYLRVLYASIGQPHDPATGAPIRRQTPQQIADQIMAYPAESRIMVLAPLVRNQSGEFRDVLDKLKREGFVRARIDGEIIELSRPEPIRLAREKRHHIEAVVDRLVVKPEIQTRLADSVDLALRLGESRMIVLRRLDETDGEMEKWEPHRYSTDFCNPETDFTLPPLTPKHFSFNSHFGACPVCHGIGSELHCDPGLVIPDPSLSLSAGAVRPWHKQNKRLSQYYAAVLAAVAKHAGVSMDTPYSALPETFHHLLLYGSGDVPVEMRGGKVKGPKPFDGVLASLTHLYETSESELSKNRLRAYMSPEVCKTCRGARLKPEILAVTLRDTAGRQIGIHQFCDMTIGEALAFTRALDLSPVQRQVSVELLREIQGRLEFLLEVGLGYLSLKRESGTLSGGEAQRIRLATQIGSGLAGVLYVLDEPSIGLHQRDNDRLIGTMRRLRDMGNSVIVVEHDEDTIRAADHLLDLGPGAGPRGGYLVAQGTVEEVIAVPSSLTGQYLSGGMKISVPKTRVLPGGPKPGPKSRVAGGGWLVVRGATENNLRDIDGAFPIGCFTCVTGVSGSGKSTLVDDILRRALFRHFHRSKERPGAHREITGLEEIDKAIVIDQNAIGRTPRSNPVTYSGAFGPVRELFSQLPAARIRGYDAGRFSFNVKGGRCENCEGDGVIRIEMHFLADVYVECEVCRGKRYNRETLEMTFKGKNIADVLEMSVDEASRFFRSVPAISDRLVALEDVGLGYLRLGQPATTLSGGEAQRVKLATELAKKATGRTVYILDEPTTGLHFADIQKLLEVLLKLRDSGNTLIVIEHNLEMIKCADWIIDMGPEGGDGGGWIVAEGTPEKVAMVEASHTGHYLRRILR